MKQLIILLFFVTSHFYNSFAQTHKIIESTPEYIKIEFNFENAYRLNETIIDGKKLHSILGKDLNDRIPGEPWLPNYLVNVGIPHNSSPAVRILSVKQEKIRNIFVLPTPDSLNQPYQLLPYNRDIYNSSNYFPDLPADIEADFVMRYARIVSLSIAPYQFNPVSRELNFNKKIIVQVDFKINPNDFRVINRINDKMTDDIINSSVINPEIAKEFTGKPVSDSQEMTDPYWYNPQKDYYKIYLNEKGVYRITYDMLVNAGAPPSGLQDMRLELFCNGESVPIDVVDADSNGFFNEGDYFQFVGEPAKPADQFTRMNIYNTSNVYWFSYQADSVNYYRNIDGTPTGTVPPITNTIKTLKWEKDFSYQRFGHGSNEQRDYWHWSFAEARNRMPGTNFEYYITDSIAQNFVVEKPQTKIKVGMHGLTSTSCPSQNGHNATIKFNTKSIGSINWNGQEPAEYQKDFYLALYTNLGGDTVQLHWENLQKFEVELNGDICDTVQTDIVLINYIELQYWRWNRTYPNYFFFTSPPNEYGEKRFYLWRWMRDNMKVYIPNRGKLISNPLITNDSDLSVWFKDTLSGQTDYYCVADDYYILPDSIIHYNSFSDLRNNMNGADYIIITHPLFRQAADRLADFRASNLSGFSSPRVQVVDINDIYKEFSYGLLNPFALRDFAKYAFENWQEPAPKFIVLFGDASYDYRSIYSTSRKNFIPSIPYHDYIGNFGQLPSDNSIVMVHGNDIVPDIAIGRLSCETLEEANILVDKIITYPKDNSKQWKENAILLASGLNLQDQIALQFNSKAKELETFYLIPNGINATKVFNFPEPHDLPFYGSGPRMREEINKGAALVSYYGHGGGAQWDLIFTKDDIPELVNGDRLPFISSVTCYTAHFDNAESFGELFVKIPNKGAIGYWGSVSLTWWPTGHTMNMGLFRNLFENRNYIIGSAILSTLASGNALMIPQIAYLGDPAVELVIPKAPDFEIKSSDITISPQYPLKDDTVTVAINIRNWGVTFPDDSVLVELFKDIPDITNLIGEIKLSSFGHNATAYIQWIPGESGLYNLIARINEKDIIEELDHSDNTASRDFSVFDFGQPNIIKPVNGYYTAESKIDFVIADIGFYFDRDFNYLIQINSSNEFDGTILMQSPVLNPVDGIVKWQSNTLVPGEYFWRAVIYDAIDTNSSFIKIFTIINEDGSGYLSNKKQLQLFEKNNIDYSEQFESLILNTELKPPHPEDKFFLDSIMISLPPDSTHPSTFTTDGTYLYFAHLPAWTHESKIYKIGTGLNGTIAGENYGSIPNLSLFIYSHLFFKSGYLYTNTGAPDNLLQIDPQTGDTSRIILSDSLLLTLSSPFQIGGYYFYYDGNYLYNLAMGTSLYPDKFVLRIFDPANNWSKKGGDVIFTGSLVQRNITSFIVVDGYVIIYENLLASHLRRYRLSDGVYEEEWAYAAPSRSYYAIAYDYYNNFVYFSVFRPVGSYKPGFMKYRGTFIEANGSITSQEIGPSSKWHNFQFEIDQTNSNGTYKAYLWGKNKSSGNWEPLDTLTQSFSTLEDVDASQFNYLKFNFDLVDSSFGAGEPMKFNSLKVNYNYLPEISMIPKEMTFAPDSMLQGFDVNMNLKVHNIGYIPVDSLRLDFYLNEGDTVLFSNYITVQPDSFSIVNHTFETNNLIFNTNIKTIANSPVPEYYTFNNLIENNFFVARDSVKPVFKITFDGQEILNGDIVSAKPEVVITLEDDSPLPLNESLFTIVHNNKPLVFIPDTLEFNYTPYPNSKATITWTPDLPDGRHTLQVLAKDASGNFFDTTSYVINFFVYNQPDIVDVFNYPNPFTNDTHFTFDLRGSNFPEELRIRIYTIAGRLIREMDIPASNLKFGPVNKIYWDGRDQDGDEISNGLYFYKVIYKNGDVIKTITQKLAKVK